MEKGDEDEEMEKGEEEGERGTDHDRGGGADGKEESISEISV